MALMGLFRVAMDIRHGNRKTTPPAQSEVVLHVTACIRELRAEPACLKCPDGEVFREANIHASAREKGEAVGRR